MNKTLIEAKKIAQSLKESPLVAKELVNFFDSSSQFLDLLAGNGLDEVRQREQEIQNLKKEISNLEYDLERAISNLNNIN